MMELNSADMEWIFSGVGVFILSTIVAIYLHRNRQRIDVTITKPKPSITNFKKISLSDNTIKLDEHFFPLSSIRNILMEKKDIRTDHQKRHANNSDADVGWELLIGFVLVMTGLVCIVTLMYTGFEYGLSFIGIEGFLTEYEESSNFSKSIIGLTLILIFFILAMLKSSLRWSDEIQKWEWVLVIVISDEVIFSISSNTNKIEYLKTAIENRMKGDIDGGDISFALYNRGVHEGRLVTAIENNATGYTSGPAPFPGAINKYGLGTWWVNGDGTVTDQQNGLMWIQAPWGMDWNGETFTGKPINISWVKAKNLFGKGLFTGKTRYGRLDLNELYEIKYEKGFVNGSCKIKFSEFDDWRLATADEWQTIQLTSGRLDYSSIEFDKRKEDVKKLFPYTKTNQTFWTATGKWHPQMCEQEDISDLAVISKLLAKLEIAASVLHRVFNLKKFQNSGYTAWTCDFYTNIDQSGHIEYPVMLVRKLDNVNQRGQVI